MPERKNTLRNVYVYSKYASWWTMPRYIPRSAQSSNTTSTNRSKRSKFEQNKDGGHAMNSGNTISFVYSEQPYRCIEYKDCPMRFQNKDLQLMHVEYGHGALPKHYRCNSCFKSNRVVGFATRKELQKHKINPIPFIIDLKNPLF